MMIKDLWFRLHFKTGLKAGGELNIGAAYIIYMQLIKNEESLEFQFVLRPL